MLFLIFRWRKYEYSSYMGTGGVYLWYTKGEDMNLQHLIDGDYTQRRDLLIPEAEAYANLRYKRANYKHPDAYKQKWDRCFHARMNELAKEKICASSI
jgi:hypothetical protein